MLLLLCFMSLSRRAMDGSVVGDYGHFVVIFTWNLDMLFLVEIIIENYMT